MYRIRLLCLIVAVVVVRDTHAVAEESRQAVRALLMPIVADCCKELDVPLQEVRTAADSNNLESLDGCLLACIYKKTGMMDGKGNFDLTTTTNLVNIAVHGEDQVMATKINNECVSVNDKSVGDGAKGCERAKLLSDCFAQYKESFRLF